jgi:hypothetical protein
VPLLACRHALIINTLWLAYGVMGVLVGGGSGFGRWWVRVGWVVIRVWWVVIRVW